MIVSPVEEVLIVVALNRVQGREIGGYRRKSSVEVWSLNRNAELEIGCAIGTVSVPPCPRTLPAHFQYVRSTAR